MAAKQQGDLISRERLLRDIYFQEGRYPETHLMRMAINEQPSVDAVKVVYGENLRDHDTAFECSVCGWECWDTIPGDTSVYNYCPNCGAKMTERS